MMDRTPLAHARTLLLAVALPALTGCVERPAGVADGDASPAATEAPRASPLPDPASFEEPLRGVLAERRADVERPGADAAAWGELAMTCHTHGLHEEALFAYRRAAELDPSDSFWFHLIGLVCERLSLPEDGARAFERAMELDPNDLVAITSLARYHQERGDDAEARRLYLKTLEQDGGWIAARVGLGQLALRAGELEAAKKNLELALERFPRCGPAHAALANVLRQEGNAAEAAFHRDWSIACGSRIPMPDPFMERIDSHGLSWAARLRDGKAAGALGHWEDAVTHFRAVVRQRPDLADGRYYLALALLRTGKVEEGIAMLETLAGDDESTMRRADALLRLAEIHADRGAFVEALALIEAILASDAEHAEALVLRGDLRRRQGDLAAACADYERAVKVAPEHAAGHRGRGECLLARRAPRAAVRSDEVRAAEIERAQEALDAFERTSELQADKVEGYEGAGLARMQLWELTEGEESAAHLAAAIKEFERCIEWFPARKSAHVALIRALHTAGREQETLAAILRAQRFWPEDPLFRKRESRAAEEE